MDKIQEIKNLVAAKSDLYTRVSDEIWANPELFFQEKKAAGILQKILEEQGLTLEKDLDGMPTAFMGHYGTGGPVIAILGEFDALPALSQKAALAEPVPLVPGGPGHGCGHNALGSGALAAAVAVKEYMQAHNLQGTIRFYGCPAEEAGWSKMFLARDGFFNDVDAAITWHPSHVNTVQGSSSLANLCAYFSFKGKTAHAAAAPHLGRSALDACELMSVGVNYLREHIIQEARLHYAYQDVGGEAPNVVQEHACVKYFIRAPKIQQALDISERVKDVARGAALMTSTTVDIKFTAGMCDFVPNDVISKVLEEALQEVGAPAFDDEDRALAKKFYALYSPEEKAFAMSMIRQIYPDPEQYADTALMEEIAPYKRVDSYGFGSTDVGDVSQSTPTGQLNIACFAIGTPGHSWQLTAQSGSSLAHKGLLTAASAMALGAVKLLENPETLARAHEEYNKNIGKYVCPVGKDAVPIP